MPRINPIDPAHADAGLQSTFAAIKGMLGMVPNLFKTFAQSPTVLSGYLGFSDALSKGKLDGKQREIVALTVAQANGCGYCLSAHTVLGKGAGLSPEAMLAARHGKGQTPVENALAMFARRVVETHGHVTDADLAAARSAGLTDAQLVEVVANVAINVMTNYTNNVAQTDIDFPKVEVAA